MPCLCHIGQNCSEIEMVWFGDFLHLHSLEIGLPEGFGLVILDLPIQAQVKKVSVWRHVLHQPQMSSLASKRLIDTLDLLMAWHLCSYYPKKRSQANAKCDDGPCNPNTVPQPAFYTAFCANIMHCLLHLRTRKTLHFHYPQTQSSCISFTVSFHSPNSESRSSWPLTLRAGRGKKKVSSSEAPWLIVPGSQPVLPRNIVSNCFSWLTR